MGVPRTGSNLPNGNFIPQIYSAKLQDKFYAASTVPAIANHDWEGEIMAYGDTVNIRKVPTITINDYTVNNTISYQDVTDEKLQLLINKAKYYAFKVDYIDDYQSDLAVIDMITDAIDLNALSESARLTPLLMGGEVLDSNNVPRDGKRWAVVNPSYARQLKQSDLKSVLITGDSESPLRNGYIGEIDGMKIYVSNNLINANSHPDAANFCRMYVGHESAVSFASQFIKHEMLPLQTTFGYGIKGLQVFGFKTVKPEALCMINGF